ncbi:PAS domain-containing hybrid sensor histidine kinase/response regulator [Hymenobacter metallicola]|uniref:Sensory/regulatory protein RpfC n=1 Tax=Hymenobacter metallicola TaxID=2563114 RepID=A0A4Z0QF46_9BACT|nr:PAS domain-containing hybrid sensor histidine kinase/response regulator [Hymenobacter metallicola]TGE28657.1 response regulator [Hymenobacter metallicola]
MSAEEEIRALRRRVTELEAQLPTAGAALTPPPDVYHQLVQVAPLALYLYTPDTGAEQQLNDQLARVLHLDAPGPMLGLLHPQDRRRLRAHYALLGQDPARRLPALELRLRTRAGRWHWFRVQHTPLSTASRQLLGTLLDINADKEHAARLAQQQQFSWHQERERELVRQVIDASPNPIYVKDEAGRLILANEAYARLHQRRVAEMLSQMPTWQSAEQQQQDQDLLTTGTTLSVEECHLGPEAVPAWYHTIKKPLGQPDGTRYLLSISSNVTALKQAREAAEESARAKEVFLANMSHEIRTPMNGIVGLARLLKKTPISAQQADYLDLILTNAGSLLVVINDILDFAKMEAGRLDLESRPFDVADTVRSVSRSLALVAESKGLQLHTCVPAEPLPVVAGDAVRLGQVLVNLLNNAIKFTSSGTITVSVEPVGAPAEAQQTVRFCVADTGIGISPEKFEQVFQSFAQATSTTTRLYGGTGLGLAICKHLVELQGGHIGLDSAPGRGSRFYVTLTYPLSDQAPAPAFEAPQALPAGLLRGLRVLLVEDNPVNKLLACSLLQEWQTDSEVAADGAQALHLALHQPFDLILMDIQMPQVNGLEATAELRRTPGPNQYTPIVALTANALKTDVDSYPHAGFTDWLVKPYHENNLYQVIARNTGRTQVQEATLETTADQPAYGFEGLGKLANDPDFIRKMQQLFVDTVPQQMEELHTLLRQHDWPASARLTHSLKSTFGNLQIAEALAGIKKIEEIIKKNPDPSHLLQLHRSVHQVTTQMAVTFTTQLLA